MADAPGPAYNSTTESIPNKTKSSGPESGRKHLVFKVAQVVLSFVAFLCEEIIDQCENCGGLYFFEFVSCSAFLLGLLMIVVYWTPLKKKIFIASFRKIDFWVTVAVGGLFLLASIIFAATMDISALAQVSVAFGFLASFAFLAELWFMYKGGYLVKQEIPATGTNGTVENEPLNSPVQASA